MPAPHVCPLALSHFARVLALAVAALAFSWLPAAQAQTIPAGGTALLAAELATTGGFYANDLGSGPIAERTIVAVTGQSFSQAARVATTQPSGEHYRSAVGANVTRAVANGDVVLLHFFMRAIQTTDESGQVTAQVYAQGPAPGYVGSMSETVSAGQEWTEFFVPFTVNGSYASGTFNINFGFGAPVRPQVLELGGVEAIWYGTSRTLAEMPRTAFQYDGRAADAPWRAAAAARIEQYRKGGYTVTVKDGTGSPVAGAQVRVRQRRHAFQFGTAFVASRLLDQADANNAVYREKLLELFNAGSPENDLKWQPWIGEWGTSFSPQIAQAGLQWAKDRGLVLRGHVLVWPSTRNMPTALTAKILANDPTIPTTILSHIDEITQATKTFLNEWDVMNEPYDNHDIMDRFGQQRMIEWFQRARTNLPTAELYVNDYAILSGGGSNVAKQDAYEQTIRYIREGGGPLTGIGFQGHFSGAATGIPRMWEILQRYAAAFPDLKFRITEFDHTTDDEQLQADFLRDFLTLMISHPQMQGVQLWGFWEGAHWRANAALYRQNWDEKPNAAAYRKLVLGDWWTDVTSRSLATGVVTGRGFAGSYTAEVTVGGVTRSQDFELTTAGATLTVTLDAPTITASPAGATVAAGAAANLSVTATGTGPLTYQWRLNGRDLAGATSSTLGLTNIQPANVGVYTVAVSGAGGTRVSEGAVVGILLPNTPETKRVGSGDEVGPNIPHQNGNIYDQILVTGPAVTFRADPGQVVRASYIDLDNDIVQVEFAGAGSVTISLAGATAPAAPIAYNQPTVAYVKGHATITIVGADQSSNLSVFTVGRATAFDPTGGYNLLLGPTEANLPANNGSPLFQGHPIADYDGVADLALINIQSSVGAFGGLRCANTEFFAASGLTGVQAPGVTFAGPVYVHNIAAEDDARPVLVTGSTASGRIGITGGDMLQPNARAVAVGDAGLIEMRAGANSHGVAQPAQANAGTYDRNGQDVTATIVVGP